MNLAKQVKIDPSEIAKHASTRPTEDTDKTNDPKITEKKSNNREKQKIERKTTERWLPQFLVPNGTCDTCYAVLWLCCAKVLLVVLLASPQLVNAAQTT